MNQLETLYKSLSQRKRPEDIAQIVLEILDKDLSSSERQLLGKAAKGSLKNRWFGYTSMLQEFAQVVGAEKQVQKAKEIFGIMEVQSFDYNKVKNVNQFIETVSPLIHKQVGENNFVTDRLSRAERKEVGLDISKRNYNKKWRLLKRLEKKVLKIQRETQKVEFQKISKHGLVHHLDFENFSSDINTACFIAYYNARCNLRSLFTNKSQKRAFDEISEMLFNRCERKAKGLRKLFVQKTISKSQDNTNWHAISYIYPDQKVLAHLSDEQKGELLGKWAHILEQIAGLLEEIWTNSNIQRNTMIVQRGNDSTTWNNTAGAWNKARDNWMNLIYALGLEDILDELCFGKVMRLMAADVVAWHGMTGSQLDPNTLVWSKVPLPWKVFKGKATCNKAMIIRHCRKAGLDPEFSGWIAPRKHGIEKFTPTPELVHGVAVANPFLASVLKKHKYFSGKNVKPIFPQYN